MNISKIVSYIGWLIVALPFVLEKIFNIPAISSAPALSAIASSLGVVIAFSARVVSTIGAEGVKPFIQSSTFQQGLISLAVIWFGYYGVDFNDLKSNIETIVLSLSTIFGLVGTYKAKDEISVL